MLLQAMRLFLMRAQSQQLEFTGLLLFFFVNQESNLCMHQDGARTSSPETLPSFTILDPLWLLCFSIARRRQRPLPPRRVHGNANYNIYVYNWMHVCTLTIMYICVQYLSSSLAMICPVRIKTSPRDVILLYKIGDNC